MTNSMKRLGDGLPADTTEYPGGGKDEYAQLALSEAEYQCENCRSSALDVGLYVCAEATAGGSLGSQWRFSLADAQVLCAGCGGADGYYVGLPADDARLEELRDQGVPADDDINTTDQESIAENTSQPWHTDSQVTAAGDQPPVERSATKEPFPKALRSPEEAYREQGRLGSESETNAAEQNTAEVVDTAPPHAYSPGESTTSSEKLQQSTRRLPRWVVAAIGGTLAVVIVTVLLL